MRTRLLLALPLFLLGAAVPARANDGPGPGKPVWPRPGMTDAQLFAKAERIQSGMWHHLSPGGLLVERHRQGANAAELDHDVLAVSDAAIWTGCYAAAQVMRWRVTHDPDALDQVRHLARGLAALSDVTGVRGRLVRSVGRPLPGQRPPRGAVPAPIRDGRWVRPDVSRDQLAGVTFGWFWIGMYMDDPDLKALARRHLTDIAKRLSLDGFCLRDCNGGKTEHGELDKKLGFMPLLGNGVHAAIALATVLGAATLDPGDVPLRTLGLQMIHDGWLGALDDQHTWLPSAITSSNVFMTVISLLVLTRVPNEATRAQAFRALTKLRKATVGWWNGGICACCLVGGMRDADVLGELRATLHEMPEEASPPPGATVLHEEDIVPIRYRSRITGWAWKDDPLRRHAQPVTAPPNPRVTFTRADWLFAYWMARGAGLLRPRRGPGAAEGVYRMGVDVPSWRRSAAPPPGGFGFGRSR